MEERKNSATPRPEQDGNAGATSILVEFGDLQYLSKQHLSAKSAMILAQEHYEAIQEVLVLNKEIPSEIRAHVSGMMTCLGQALCGLYNIGDALGSLHPDFETPMMVAMAEIRGTGRSKS